MNKYQKALDALKAKYTLTGENGRVLLGVIDLQATHKAEFDTFQELIDRETPASIVEIDLDDDCYPHTDCLCPKCHEVLYDDQNVYCHNCGQKINWGEPVKEKEVMSIEEAMDFVNRHQDDIVVKKYDEARRMVITEYERLRDIEEEHFYKASKKRDYYLVPPRKLIDIKNGKWTYITTGWDIHYKDIGREKITGHCCLCLCRYNEEEIKKKVEKYIKQDNEEE